MKQEILAHFGVYYLIKDLFTRKKKLRDLFAAGPLDITFLALVIALLTIGIIMMFSASYVNAWYDADAKNDPYYYVKKQVFYAILGVVLMIAVSYVKPDVFRDVSGVVMIIAILLLLYVLINPYEVPGKEQFKRWMWVPVIGTFQPSEIAKLALIMFLAFSMERHHKKIEKNAWMIVPYGVIIVMVCALVYAENHVSGTLLILGIGVAMMFFGGIKMRWFVAGAVIVAIVGIWFVFNADKFLEGYASERIRIWLKLLFGEELTAAETRGSGWQSQQSLYAIGSGGLFGLGFGNSKQKHMYLPEPQNDFVFAVVCEELGFIRALLIILLFILLVGRGFIIGLRARSRYEALLAMGISFQVGLQAALNIAVVTATVPNTGISLPFFSYGGTALVILLFEMGIVLSISRNSERKIKNARK
ncbi:MAG: cell division protein FtsW [Clostridia bacterium]|nr:cell division protein FtsW [Clostridia bacterium]